MPFYLRFSKVSKYLYVSLRQKGTHNCFIFIMIKQNEKDMNGRHRSISDDSKTIKDL